MSKKIDNIGQLREFVVVAMQEVKDGGLDLDRADRIKKLATTVNESFFAEARISKMLSDANRQVPPVGTLAIGPTVALSE